MPEQIQEQLSKIDTNMHLSDTEAITLAQQYAEAAKFNNSCWGERPSLRIDWAKLQEMTTKIHSSTTLEKIYKSFLTQTEHKKTTNSSTINLPEGENSFEEAASFFSLILTKLYSEDSGRSIVHKIFEQGSQTFPRNALEGLGGYAENSKDVFNANVIPELFKINPENAKAFFSDYLLDLHVYRTSQWDSSTITDKDGKNIILATEQENFPTRDNLLFPHEKEIEDHAWNYFGTLDSDDSRTISSIIRSLGEHGDKKSIDKLIEFVITDQAASAYMDIVSQALGKIDLTEAASALLKKLKNPITKWGQKLTTNLLYRLEFGKIGISEDGVKYLERMYDLGVYNNPDFHVSRLTPTGEVGIFNEEKELIKYFQLGDLTDEEKSIKAEVLDFTYNTLFFGNKDESEEERTKRLAYLNDFKKHYYRLAQDKIFKESGVQLNNLAFREQGWFLIYLDHASQEEKDRLSVFTTKYQEEGIKTFLALEHGEELGRKILQIGEMLNDKGADRIFAKYNNIAGLIDNINQQLSEMLAQQGNPATVEEISQATNHLLDKAKQVLIKFARATEKQPDLNFSNIKQELNKISERIILFASAYKTAAEHGALNLDEIRGAELTVQKAADLSPADRNKILEIYKDNRPSYPQELLNKTTEDLAKALNDPNKRFYLFKIDGELTSFLRFDDLPDGKKHIASFNVRPEVKGSAIGAALLQKALELEGWQSEIEGEIYQHHPKLESYLEFFRGLDFTVSEEPAPYGDTGKLFYRIKRPAQMKLAA